MRNDSRRSFIKAAAFSAIAPLGAQTRAIGSEAGPTGTTDNQLPPLSSGMTSVVSIMGHLKRNPVFLTNLTRGVLSDPVALDGNGIYRLSIEKVASDAGQTFSVVLADAGGNPLLQKNIGSGARSIFGQCGIAVFRKYSVMVFVGRI